MAKFTISFNVDAPLDAARATAIIDLMLGVDSILGNDLSMILTAVDILLDNFEDYLREYPLVNPDNIEGMRECVKHLETWQRKLSISRGNLGETLGE